MNCVLTVQELSEKINGKIIGKSDIKISGVSDLVNAKNSDVSFILSPKYLESAISSAAPVIISDSLEHIQGKTVIKVQNVKIAYIKAINIFYPPESIRGYISKNSSIALTAKLGIDVFIDDFVVVKDNTEIGDGSYIGVGSFIGKSCVIGKNVRIFSRVSIYDRTIIGDNTIIHSGAVIGSDGFGFVENNGEIIKIPQIGNVIIGRNVEIGANTTIDRASFGSTFIDDDVKIDNLVQIAHNVRIGKGTIIAAQTGIAGSTQIGKYCLIAGQVGFVDHITIGDFVKIGAQAGVAKDLPDRAEVTGSPARPIKELRKAEAYMMKLEELFKKVKEIYNKLNK
ncbi:MAG: UDP-3-O-(3-hydroxymyristoyl)glucosamine N-acyltransferase [Candidatus Goldbacteria bacterium]|nr:UDP-3-O-(3-hydroxymyristoyl)glucosamine N-acyltransferase [Candidatus Goldiibacteriota bacterium]